MAHRFDTERICVAERSRKGSIASSVAYDQRGFGVVSVLLALLILAALYFGYFRMQDAMRPGGGPASTLDAAKAVACRSNRQTIEREIAMWSVNHPDEAPSLSALEADGLHVPSCPQGGRYEISGRSVHCNLHN